MLNICSGVKSVQLIKEINVRTSNYARHKNFSESLKGSDHLGEPSVDGRAIYES
jgi:hypothetical protein